MGQMGETAVSALQKFCLCLILMPDSAFSVIKFRTKLRSERCLHCMPTRFKNAGCLSEFRLEKLNALAAVNLPVRQIAHAFSVLILCCSLRVLLLCAKHSCGVLQFMLLSQKCRKYGALSFHVYISVKAVHYYYPAKELSVAEISRIFTIVFTVATL